MRLVKNLMEILKYPICDNCLGRIIGGQLLHGLSNKERGKIFRYMIAFLIDSGEKFDIDYSNFYEIEFRNFKFSAKKKRCFVCKNFFEKDLEKYAKKIISRIKKIEFDSFLVGCRPKEEMVKAEEKIFEKIGIEFVERIKEEINREVGKIIEKKLKKKFDPKNPDITILLDLENDRISVQIKSLFIFGKYKKLVRNIPQSKWICRYCKGKGCLKCKGKGKLYPTSIQEIIEKPLLKATKAKKSKFHASGREDIDARCLDYRPFVIELVKPLKRKINLAKIRREINKSKKIKVSSFKFVDHSLVKQIKSQRNDKTYLVVVTFSKKIDEKKLKEIKKLKTVIEQKTPLRVLHRRAAKTRKRLVKSIRWKLISAKKLELKIRAQAGLYIKELITGDNGRTKPNLAEILENKPKKILLDVIKIHG